MSFDNKPYLQSGHTQTSEQQRPSPTCGGMRHRPPHEAIVFGAEGVSGAAHADVLHKAKVLNLALDVRRVEVVGDLSSTRRTPRNERGTRKRANRARQRRTFLELGLMQRM
jgi:hypothetical protein